MKPSKPRRRNRGLLFNDRGRALLREWMWHVAGADPVPEVGPVPTQQHERASGISRTSLRNLLHDRLKGFDPPTVDPFCRVIGGGASPAEFFYKAEDAMDGPPASRAPLGRKVADAVADLARFDFLSCSPRGLASQARELRELFLSQLRLFEGVVEELEREGRDSPAVQEVVATYCLTYADQVLISPGDAKQSLASADRWIGRAAAPPRRPRTECFTRRASPIRRRSSTRGASWPAPRRHGVGRRASPLRSATGWCGSGWWPGSP